MKYIFQKNCAFKVAREKGLAVDIKRLLGGHKLYIVENSSLKESIDNSLMQAVFLTLDYDGLGLFEYTIPGLSCCREELTASERVLLEDNSLELFLSQKKGYVFVCEGQVETLARKLRCQSVSLSELVSEEHVYSLCNPAYDHGFVAYCDILGFGNFSLNQSNFNKIYNLFSDVDKIINERISNQLFGKMIHVSDSVFFTAEDCEVRDFSYFKSFAMFVSVLRDCVSKYVSTDIRAAVVYGDYYYDGNGNIFGPAVTRAVKLAEKSGEVTKLTIFENNPAAIVIDKSCFGCRFNINGEMEDLLSHSRFFVPVGEEFYLANPFEFVFDLVSPLYHDDDLNKAKNKYYQDWKERIDANPEYRKKYSISLNLLDKFCSN